MKPTCNCPKKLQFLKATIKSEYMLIDPHKAYSLHEKGQLCEHYCITACLLGFTFADSNN